MSAAWGGEQTSNRQARWVTLVILVVILTAWHAYGQEAQGHVEWIPSAVDAHSANVWVGNDLHTVECNSTGCAVDSAYGYSVVVLADGSKQMASGNPALVQLAKAAKVAAINAPVPTQQHWPASWKLARALVSRKRSSAPLPSSRTAAPPTRCGLPSSYTLSEGTLVVK